MTDPFQDLRQAGVSTVGYGRLDAPDVHLRKIAIKAQAGLPLSDREVSALARRQAVEREVASRAAASVGDGSAGVPYSMNQNLAGTRLDPRVQQAAGMQAQNELELSPVLQNVRIAQARQALLDAELATSPEARRARELELAASAAQNEALLQQSELVQPLAGYSFSQDAEPSAQAAPSVAPAQPAAPGVPKKLSERITGQLPLTNGSREEIFMREVARRYGNQPVPAVTLAKVRDELTPKPGKRTVLDPLTQAAYEVDVDVDALGNVYRVGAPALKTEGPFADVDKAFSKDFATWTTGGSQQVRTNLEQLKGAVEYLRKPGTIAASGGLTSLWPEGMRKRFTSDASASVRATIEGVVQQSLREILGAAFTEKEGQALLSRAFDTTQTEEENARRAEVLLGTLARKAAEKDAAAAYFRDTGTLSGFQSSIKPGDVSADFEKNLANTTEVAPAPVKAAQSRAEAARAAYLKNLQR